MLLPKTRVLSNIYEEHNEPSTASNLYDEYIRYCTLIIFKLSKLNITFILPALKCTVPEANLTLQFT